VSWKIARFESHPSGWGAEKMGLFQTGLSEATKIIWPVKMADEGLKKGKIVII
jgi:hypothetical protein